MHWCGICSTQLAANLAATNGRLPQNNGLQHQIDLQALAYAAVIAPVKGKSATYLFV
jgi:hypothetical protein